jgi:hypothetical protein
MPPVINSLSPEAAALFDLPSDACHWPVNDGWCGQPAMKGRSYCVQHYQESRAKVQHNSSPLTINRWLHQIGIPIEHEQRPTWMHTPVTGPSIARSVPTN